MVYPEYRSLIATCGLSLTLLITGVAGVAANGAAQVSTPATTKCIAPELPPGTPTPMDQEAGPMEGDEGGPPPVADPADLPSGEAADDETAEAAEAAIANALGCYNQGEFVALGALFTADGLMSEFGTTNPYDLPLFLEGGPPATLSSVSDVQVHDDGQISADVVSSFGAMQQRERWFLVEQDGTLLVDGIPDLAVEVPADATTIDAELVDYAFELSEDTVEAGTIVINVTNTGEYPHELLIIGLPEGATVEEVFDDPSLESEVKFYGVAFAMPGEEATQMVLVGLEPGTYTLICFVDEPEGIPHAMRGMVAELTIT